MTNPTLNGYPEDLPRRQTTDTRLPDWNDPSSVRAWIFRPVPVATLESSAWARDPYTVQRLYSYMLAEGWSGSHARS